MDGAWDDLAQDPPGEAICPFWNTNRVVRDDHSTWDTDHYPKTWDEIKKSMPEGSNRNDYLDAYNGSVRIMCRSCNRSNQWNGLPAP